MVEVCYDRMTEILSCGEFSADWECHSMEKANFISRKTLQALPKVVVDEFADFQKSRAAVFLKLERAISRLRTLIDRRRWNDGTMERRKA
jgi:hypothetical protein